MSFSLSLSLSLSVPPSPSLSRRFSLSLCLSASLSLSLFLSLSRARALSLFHALSLSLSLSRSLSLSPCKDTAVISLAHDLILTSPSHQLCSVFLKMNHSTHTHTTHTQMHRQERLDCKARIGPERCHRSVGRKARALEEPRRPTRHCNQRGQCIHTYIHIAHACARAHTRSVTHVDAWYQPTFVF